MPKISLLNDGTGLTLTGAELWPGVQGSTTYKFTVQQILALTGLGPTLTTVDKTVPRFNGTAGKLQTSGVAIDNSNNVTPVSNDGGALGTSALKWSDIFLASGGVVDFNNGDARIRHAAGQISFEAAANGYQFSSTIYPSANDGGQLGQAAVAWSALFLASGAVVGFGNGNYTVTHSAGVLTFSGAIALGSALPVASGGTGQITAPLAVGNLINASVEDTGPDWSADFLGSYDASAATGKKVKLSTLTRERLFADRTYAVSKTGSDSNTGLATGVANVTFTNGSANIGWTTHGLSVGNNFRLATSGGLPTNFGVGDLYYVKSVGDANTITASLTSGGTAVSAGSAGSGTHNATVYSPFLTIQKVVDTISGAIDHNGFASTGQIGGGSYAENVQLRGYVGRGIQGHTTPILQGSSSDASVVKVAPASGNCFLGVSQSYCEWTISNMEINSTGGIGVLADAGSWVCIGTGCRFGGTATTHIEAENFGIAEIVGNYTVFAGAVLHLAAVVNGLIFYTGNTVTISGAPAFSAAWAYADYEGVIEANGVTYSGSATGVHFIQDHGGSFHIGGADPNSTFPGNANGSYTPWPAVQGGTGNNIYAVGDLLSASTTTALSKIAAVAAGSVFASAGTSTLPAWTTAPSLIGSQTILNATAIPAGGTAGAGYKFSSTSNLGVFFGSGAPTLAAAQGSLYLRTDGSSTSTRIYVNTNGSTGWTNVVTAA